MPALGSRSISVVTYWSASGHVCLRTQYTHYKHHPLHRTNCIWITLSCSAIKKIYNQVYSFSFEAQITPIPPNAHRLHNTHITLEEQALHYLMMVT